MTEDEMVGWHHRLNGHEFEQALGVGDGQGSLMCCSPQGHNDSDTTEQLNWTEHWAVTSGTIERNELRKKRLWALKCLEPNSFTHFALELRPFALELLMELDELLMELLMETIDGANLESWAEWDALLQGSRLDSCWGFTKLCSIVVISL